MVVGFKNDSESDSAGNSIGKPPAIRMPRLTSSTRLLKCMAADNEFHSQLYTAADKQDIWALVRSRSGHIDRLRRMHLPSPGKAQDIVRHHRLIVKAIEAGEPDGAQRHLRTHLSGTLSELARIRSRYPEYLSN